MRGVVEGGGDWDIVVGTVDVLLGALVVFATLEPPAREALAAVEL
jgi:hypothetical protein